MNMSQEQRLSLMKDYIGQDIKADPSKQYIIVAVEDRDFEGAMTNGIQAVQVKEFADYPKDLDEFVNEWSQLDYPQRTYFTIVPVMSKISKDMLITRLDNLDQKVIRGRMRPIDYTSKESIIACIEKKRTDKEQKQEDEKKHPTKDTLERWLSANGYEIRRNKIKRATDITKGELPEISSDRKGELGLVYLKEKYLETYSISEQRFYDQIELLAEENSYNPVLDILDRADPWDGTDRLEEIFGILHISTVDKLSRTLIKKWFMQCCAMQYNGIDGKFGADGVLTLVGEQGIGKTRFFNKICFGDKHFDKYDLFKDGQYLAEHEKDTYIQATAYFVTELGEIEKTMRTSPEWLKSFLTRDSDEFRAPYGRDPIKITRYTSFCGSCNSDLFLRDETGNRRFWTIPVTSIDLEQLEKFNVLQFWKQIDFMILNSRNLVTVFRLTKEERDELERRNRKHVDKVPAQQEIEDIFSKIHTGYEIEITASDFIKKYDLRYSAKAVTRALTMVLGKEKVREKNHTKVFTIPAYTSDLSIEAQNTLKAK